MNDVSGQETLTTSKGTRTTQEPPSERLSVCLIGGLRIVRLAIEEFLKNQGLQVRRLCDDEKAIADYLSGGAAKTRGLIVLLVTNGALSTYPLIKEMLEGPNPVPLVVLSDQISRGQVYAALRMGAKALVNLNADPQELATAIKMASSNKVYLSPEAAELLITDISGTVEPSRNSKKPSPQLSRREMEIVHFLCNGLSSKEIAKSLHLSTKTIENHRYNIYRKCDVESIAGLIRHAVQQGLVSF